MSRELLALKVAEAARRIAAGEVAPASRSTCSIRARSSSES